MLCLDIDNNITLLYTVKKKNVNNINKIFLEVENERIYNYERKRR